MNREGSQRAQPRMKRLEQYLGPVRIGAPDNTDLRNLPRLLRRDGEWRREEADRAADERSPVGHWTISSARASTAGGMVRPRAFAVLRLMTSSNLVGFATGRSAGLVPLKILST